MKPIKKQVTFLHGNLGLPIDWNETLNELAKISPETDVACLDLWSFLSDPNPLERLALRINQRNGEGSRHVLVGYSLGGRLALSIVDRFGCQVDQLVLVAANIKLLTPNEKQVRLRADTEWARKFLDPQYDWKRLIGEWNAQKIFENTAGAMRDEGSFDRQAVGRAFQEWSSGKLEMPDLKDWKGPPILWIGGSKDTALVNVGTDLPVEVERIVIEGAGHRVLLDNPKRLAQIIAAK